MYFRLSSIVLCSRDRDELKMMHHDNYNTTRMMLLLAKTLLIVYLDTVEWLASVHTCTTSLRNFIVLNDQAYSMFDRIRDVFDFGRIRYFLQKPAKNPSMRWYCWTENAATPRRCVICDYQIWNDNIQIDCGYHYPYNYCVCAVRNSLMRRIELNHFQQRRLSLSRKI